MAEPIVRFFIIGALLFVAHRLVVGDARVIVVSRGVKADLERRFRDRTGRAPTASELESDLAAWKRDEALYREALKDRLDRDDAAIRLLLADRVRARAAAGARKREPTDAELDRWLAEHRSQYEAPRRYDYQFVAFHRAEARAAEQRDRFEQAVTGGANPAALGRPVIGGTLTVEELRERVGPELAARIPGLPVGRWQRLETPEDLLLVRLNAVQGGLPDAGELHQRMVSDWWFAERQRAVDQAVQAIVARYRFEERR